LLARRVLEKLTRERVKDARSASCCSGIKSAWQAGKRAKFSELKHPKGLSWILALTS
jgi:hypothetical protein